MSEKKKSSKRKESASKLKLKDKWKQIRKVYAFFLKNAYAHDPKYFAASMVNMVAESIFPFIDIVFIPLIIDELITSKRLNYVIGYLAAMLVLNFIVNYVAGRSELEAEKYQADIDNYFKELMAERTMDMDFALTEDPKALDQLEKAKEGIAYAGAGWTINSLKYIVASMLQLIGALAMVILVAPWTLLISLYSIIATAIVNGKNNRDEVAFYQKRASVNRAYKYACSEIADIRYGKDIRLYHAVDMMLGNTAKYIKKIASYWKSQADRRTKIVIIDCACGALSASLMYSYLGYLSITHVITIGVFTQLLSLGNTIGNAMTGITYNSQDILKISNYSYEFVKFMEYPAMIYKGEQLPKNQAHTIELRHVSFRYPNTDQLILHDVNMKIESGEHISVVGLNGAGKTTFVKLLCRLYEVTEGEILLDGVNIKEYDYASYMSLFAPVFQDFKLFAFSTREIIMAGDYKEPNREDIMEGDYEDLNREDAEQRRNFLKLVTNVCKIADMDEKISSLASGYDTPIFKTYEEGGVELSGGEQQKLAIARAVYKNSPIMILDEPTAALDPLAEYEVYKKFNQIAGGKTSIFISHRLSSCRFCDRIVVFSEGTIKEDGTHQILSQMKQGIYARMWEIQAKYYEEQANIE